MRIAKSLMLAAVLVVSSIVATLPVAAQRYDYSSNFNAYDATAASVGLVVWCCIVLGGLVFNLVLAYLVYRDSKKNNVANGIIWAIVTFFFNVIGILVYFLAIKPEAMKKATPVAAVKSESKESKVETK